MPNSQNGTARATAPDGTAVALQAGTWQGRAAWLSEPVRQPGIYTVQSADSLSSIAAYFYRIGNRWSDIQRENDFLAEKPDLIYAGQVLIIPK